MPGMNNLFGKDGSQVCFLPYYVVGVKSLIFSQVVVCVLREY